MLSTRAIGRANGFAIFFIQDHARLDKDFTLDALFTCSACPRCRTFASTGLVIKISVVGATPRLPATRRRWGRMNRRLLVAEHAKPWLLADTSLTQAIFSPYRATPSTMNALLEMAMVSIPPFSAVAAASFYRFPMLAIGEANEATMTVVIGKLFVRTCRSKMAFAAVAFHCLVVPLTKS